MTAPESGLFREAPRSLLRTVRMAVENREPLDPEAEAAILSQTRLPEGEPVLEELCKLLPLMTAEDLQRYAPVLAAAIPELKPLIGFDQRSPHHAYDLYTHVAYVVAGVPGDLVLRWAALLHDIGKVPTFTRDETGRGHFYGHAKVGADMADKVLRRLQAPEDLRKQAVQLIELHMTKLEPDKEALRQAVETLGRETVEKLLHLQEADMASKGVGIPPELAQFPLLRTLLEEI